MTNGQLSKFHVLKGQWAKKRTELGRPADDAALAALKVRTIGRDCSSTKFTQDDLDAMIGAFLAELKPADFNAQMDQQDQPGRRRAVLMDRARAACKLMGQEGGEVRLVDPSKAAGYIGGTAQRMFKKWPEKCTEDELRRVVIELEQHAARLVKRMKDHAAGMLANHRAPGAEAVDAAPMPKPRTEPPKEYMEPGEDF